MYFYKGKKKKTSSFYYNNTFFYKYITYIWFRAHLKIIEKKKAFLQDVIYNYIKVIDETQDIFFITKVFSVFQNLFI